MPNSHEVISAFVDNEPFDAQELAAALADPAGRELLLDLLALGQLVQPEKAPALMMAPRAAHRGLRLLAAAAVMLALLGGYQLGRHTAPTAVEMTSVRASDVPPAPTRVIDLTPGVNWHDNSGGQ